MKNKAGAGTGPFEGPPYFRKGKEYFTVTRAPPPRPHHAQFQNLVSAPINVIKSSSKFDGARLTALKL